MQNNLVISWSQTQKFTGCQRKWGLAYKDRLTPLVEYDSSVPQVRGTIFHVGIKAMLTALHHGKPVDSAYVEGIYAMEEHSTQMLTQSQSEYWAATVAEGLALAKTVWGYYVPKLGLGGRYMPVSIGGVLAVEYEFEVSLARGLRFRGAVDAVLYDKETGEVFIVDWKVRKAMPKELNAVVDGQLHAYAAVINKLLKKQAVRVHGQPFPLDAPFYSTISRVRMWQFKGKLPAKPEISAKNVKACNTGRASYDTTWEFWADQCRLLDIDPEPYRDVMLPKMKTHSAFENVIDSLVTPDSDETALEDLTAKGIAIRDADKKVTRGSTLPAALSSLACQFCPYKEICIALRYKQSLEGVLQERFKSGDKPFDFSEDGVESLTEDEISE